MSTLFIFSYNISEIKNSVKYMIINISADNIDECVSKNMLIIDVRSKSRYDIGHVKGAKNILLENIEDTNLDNNIREMVVYCDRGGKSLQAARLLSKKGYRVFNIVGGIKEYKGKNMVK